jgi:hypothetical protein
MGNGQMEEIGGRKESRIPLVYGHSMSEESCLGSPLDSQTTDTTTPAHHTTVRPHKL